MKNKTIMVLSMLLIGVLFSVSTFAAETGATITNASVLSGTSSTSGSINISAGQVQEVNLSSNSITDKWAGFFGSLSGGISLNDGTNDFYTWSVTNFTGSVVYAATGAVSNWSSLSSVSYANVPAYLKVAASDNYTSTFNTEDTFDSPSRGSITSNSTTTLGGSSLQSFALYADGENVWGAEAKNDVNAFDGSTVDYQLLVPAQTDTTYYFYMELS